MKRATIVTVIAAISVVASRGQGFLNLDFESVQNLPGNPGIGALLPATNALPDWTAYDGTLALSQVYYVSNDAGHVSSSIELEGGSLALSGNLSVGLYSDSSISQMGLVPDGAESLLFEAQGPGPRGSIEATDLSIALGGQTLAYSVLSIGTDYSVYGANIPADLDGQMAALIFSCEGVGSGNLLLDNIEFSPTSVPEPGGWALIGVWVVLFGVLRLRLAPVFAALRRGKTARHGRGKQDKLVSF